MAAVARRVRVRGLVQGVFFRAWTSEQAARLGVSGWVRNCSDGSVEAHVEGDPDLVEQLIGAMRHGPHGARVEAIDEEEAQSCGFGRFEVRH